MSDAPASAPTPMSYDQFMGPQAPAGVATPPMSYHDFLALPAPGVPAGKTTGKGANIAAGALEGVAGLASTFEFQPVFSALRFADKAFGTHLAPDTPSQQIERSPAVAGVAPGDASEKLLRAGTAGLVSAGPMGLEGGLAGVAKAGLSGVSAGVTGQAAADVVPERFADPANRIGQLAGGVAPHLLFAPVRVAAGMLKDTAKNALAATSLGTPEPVIDPQSGQPIMRAGTGIGDIPPEPLVARPGNARLVGQRLAARAGMEPQALADAIPTGPFGGNAPGEVPGSQATLGQTTGNVGLLGFERQLRTANREPFTEQEARNTQARTAELNAIAPADASASAGDRLRQILQEHQQAVETATTQGRAGTISALEGAGIRPNMPTAAVVGETQRGDLEGRRQPVKDAASAALDEIDPEGDLRVNARNLGRIARRIRDDEIGEGGSTHATEMPLLNAASDYSGVIPFSRLRSLMSNTTAALRQISRNPELGRESQPYRRMSMLLTAIHDNIIAAADRSAEGNPSRGAPGELPENFSPDDQAAIQSANRDYAIYKDRFRSGAVGDVMASGGQPGTFKVSDAATPGRLWRPGAAGADAVNSVVRAAGSPEEAIRVLGDGPALSLRDAAVRDGQISETGYNKWMRDHAPALAVLPDLRARFGTIEAATRTAEQAATRARQQLDAYQDSAARFYLGKTDAGATPITAIQKLMTSENPAAAATDLMGQVGTHQAAIDGVRRNVMEWAMQRARTSAEAGTSGATDLSHAAMDKMIHDPKIRAAMEAILTPDQMARFRGVANDLRVANRAITAARIPGSPGTAADLAALRHAHPSNLVMGFLGDKAGELVAGLMHIKGAMGTMVSGAGAIGGLLLKKAKLSGIADMDDLAVQTVLNPVVGKVMAQRAVANPNAPVMKRVYQAVATSGAVPALAGVAANSKQQENVRQ